MRGSVPESEIAGFADCACVIHAETNSACEHDVAEALVRGIIADKEQIVRGK